MFTSISSLFLLYQRVPARVHLQVEFLFLVCSQSRDHIAEQLVAKVLESFRCLCKWFLAGGNVHFSFMSVMVKRFKNIYHTVYFFLSLCILPFSVG